LKRKIYPNFRRSVFKKLPYIQIIVTLTIMLTFVTLIYIMSDNSKYTISNLKQNFYELFKYICQNINGNWTK